MLSLLDIAERTQKGPKMEENAWNMGLFRKMNELTKQYQLYYPKDNTVFSCDFLLRPASTAFQQVGSFNLPGTKC